MGFKRLFVANRGEIAVRIQRAARAYGLEVVQPVSAADRDSLAARQADRCVVIGPAQSKASYLNARLLVHAAAATGCDALHPGYGFLSERAELARLCAEAGIAFVGPEPETIDLLGDKLAARAAAERAGVPIVPGVDRLDDPKAALRAADDLGYPVILKASAGGGGRGVTVVHRPDALTAAFDRSSHEAAEAFGDGTLYMERYVENARHVEVQVLGDGQGAAVHFGERDCSVQRRYQKIVEEAPAAIMPEDVRLRLHRAALDLVTAARYRNAGTVEFLYDVDRNAFYFIEVNARIQVEHPVSEEIAGVDLVGLQLAVAEQHTLPMSQDSIHLSGHAVEMRINAEDPARQFLPQPGRVDQWRAPSGPGIRLDTHMTDGAMVPPFYDSLIAKLIASGPDRPTALARLGQALDAFRIEGLTTNLPLQRFIARHGDFQANRINTRWLEQHLLPAFDQQNEAADGAY
ncbi:MAG: acetyl/propionyl/methylcrotonyl-CoA carboxylase subunit alpha [Rhodothalassiaceae bacterium]